MDYNIDNTENDIDVISLAFAGYDAINRFMAYKREDSFDWNDLEDRDKYIYVLVAKSLLCRQIETPEEVHSYWKKLMLQNGHKYREDETNIFRKWDSALTNWKNLSTFDKERFYLLTALILSLKEFFLEV